MYKRQPKTHGIRKKAELDEIVERSLRDAAIWDEVKDRLRKNALGPQDPGRAGKLTMLAAPRSKDRSNTGKTTKPSPYLALPNTEAVSLTDLDFCRHRDRSKKDSRKGVVP